jgi:hypothetical protein
MQLLCLLAIVAPLLAASVASEVLDLASDAPVAFDAPVVAVADVHNNGGLSLDDAACASLEHALLHVSFALKSNLRSGSGRRLTEGGSESQYAGYAYSLDYEHEGERVSLAQRRPFLKIEQGEQAADSQIQSSSPKSSSLSLCLSREESYSLTLHSDAVEEEGEAAGAASASASASAVAPSLTSVRGGIICGQYFAPLNEAFDVTHAVLSTCYKFSNHYKQEQKEQKVGV